MNIQYLLELMSPTHCTYLYLSNRLKVYLSIIIDLNFMSMRARREGAIIVIKRVSSYIDFLLTQSSVGYYKDDN